MLPTTTRSTQADNTWEIMMGRISREDEAITPLGNDCTSFKGSEPGAVPSKTLVRNRGKEVKTAL